MTAKLISIIGPPAVGKTTLAEALARELPAGIIYEDYAGNPFLADSYVGPRETRLPAQLYFLMSRVKQLSAAAWPAEGVLVSDYGFCQDRIYAAARLDEDELRLYDRVARRVSGLVHRPEVIVHLDAPESTLLDRIAARAREYEKAMTLDFLHAMRIAYNGVEHDPQCAVIAVDAGEADLLDARARGELAARIRERL